MFCSCLLHLIIWHLCEVIFTQVSGGKDWAFWHTYSHFATQSEIQFIEMLVPLYMSIYHSLFAFTDLSCKFSKVACDIAYRGSVEKVTPKYPWRHTSWSKNIRMRILPQTKYIDKNKLTERSSQATKKSQQNSLLCTIKCLPAGKCQTPQNYRDPTIRHIIIIQKSTHFKQECHNTNIEGKKGKRYLLCYLTRVIRISVIRQYLI